MQGERHARAMFWSLWLGLFVVRVALASHLPLFVDEAFYWQEGRHLAWAYSDLPGLTAWLVRLGTALGGEQVLALRAPFLLIGALLPLIMVAAARSFGATRAWQVGSLVLLFPLTGLLGVLALPDVPLNLAAAACLLGGLMALQGNNRRAAIWLGSGLLVGALSHYRFLGVAAVGFIALLCLAQGREALRRWSFWLAIAAGALAWLPLVLWNLDHGEAGWRFQLLDRHPWRAQVEGLRFLLIQAVLATPLLALALLSAARRFGPSHALAERWFALCGGLTVLGFFLLGFFADSQRVSFHWPVPGYLALLVLVPQVLARWGRRLRQATIALLALGLLLALGVAGVIGSPHGRAALAGTSAYPENFAGWQELAVAVRAERAKLPVGTILVADHFKLGAELGFAFADPDVAVLEHPLNAHHGRARQLEIWGLTRPAREDSWRLLVVGASDVKFSTLLSRYHELCRQFGSLPPARVVEVDGGARRFLLLVLPPGRGDGACITPAIAHVDSPQAGAVIGRQVTLRGWAAKDIAGIARVVILLDGEPLANAVHGETNVWIAGFLGGQSRDPKLPDVQFTAKLDVPTGVAPGRHLLGLELHGGDGSVERWSGPWVRVVDVGDGAGSDGEP